MQNFLKDISENTTPSSYKQYPWADNHKDAINWITRYMDTDAESMIQRLDERILSKVAREHHCY